MRAGPRQFRVPETLARGAAPDTRWIKQRANRHRRRTRDAKPYRQGFGFSTSLFVVKGLDRDATRHRKRSRAGREAVADDAREKAMPPRVRRPLASLETTTTTRSKATTTTTTRPGLESKKKKRETDAVRRILPSRRSLARRTAATPPSAWSS
jgi:hypothetical protein